MGDDDLLLDLEGLSFGSGVIGICDICGKRQAVIVLQKERFKLCVIDFLNKTWIGSKIVPGAPLPPYRSERIWYPTTAAKEGQAPAVVLTPTKVVKHPVVLITPDVYGLTTTLLDGAIRFAKQGFEVLLPDLGRTSFVGAGDHLSLRWGARTGGGVAVGSARVRRLVRLYGDALAYLRGREMSDPDKSALFGVSYGGSFAAALAAEEPKLSALVLAYPMPIRPAEYARLVTAPTLVLAGDSDPAAARAVAQFRDASAANLTLKVVVVPSARHGFLARDLSGFDEARAESAWNEAVGFLRERLLPPPPKPPAPPKGMGGTPATGAPPAATPQPPTASAAP